MVQLTIRCHPRAPIAPEELEGWLELEVEELRAQAPHATVRLSRLAQGRVDAPLDVGWLIELELDPRAPLLAGDRLPQALTDMRLLGLEPTLLAPTAPNLHANGRAACTALPDAAELVAAAHAFHAAAGEPGVRAALPVSLASAEEALQLLSGAWYQLAAGASGIEGLSHEQEAGLMARLHEVAAAFARCARTCREGRLAITPVIDRDGGARPDRVGIA